VSLPAFWARRARRILPAALATVFLCGVGVVALVPASLWPQWIDEMRASTLYVENWQLASDAVDYFAMAENTPSPVQHFWSLSVEEQYYLLWPVLLLVTARSRRALLIGMAVLTALSLAYSLYMTAVNPAAAYFVTPARAWEFGAGGLLAFARPAVGPSTRLCAAGLAAIVAGALLFSIATPFPGWAALVPVLGAVAVIRAGAASRALAVRPVQVLGDISYSVYLWHWPLIVLAPLVLSSELTSDSRIGILMLTLLLAWLSKRLIEDPVRAAPSLARPVPTFAAAGAISLILLLLTGGASSYVEREVREAESASRAFVASKPRCFGAASRDPERPCRNAKLRLRVIPTPLEARNRANAPCSIIERVKPLQVCAFGVRKRDAQATIALLGDSHASHWRAGLEVVARRRGWRGLSITHTSCPLSTAPRNIPEPTRSSCERWRRQVFQWFKRHPEVRTIFVAAITGGNGVQSGGLEAQIRGYIGAWRKLPPSVERIIVIRDTPKMTGSTDLCVERAMARKRPAGPACAQPRSVALDRDAAAVAAARLRSQRVHTVDLTRFFCDSRCYPVIGGALVYKDYTHLTTVFAESVGPYLQQAIEREIGQAA
jgi:peptidoglycan/LPS O-acetylase OafA/YrhL